MVKYIFSNINSSMIVDNEGKAVKSIKAADQYLNFTLLKEDEWTSEENALLEEFKSEGIVLLQDKKDNKGLKFVESKQLIQKILKNIDSVNIELKPINQDITVKQIKHLDTEDHLLIQTVSSISELDKSINLLTKRLREFCEIYIPELSRDVGDNERYCELIVERTREELLKELRVVEENAMGNNLPDDDLAVIRSLANQINVLVAQRDESSNYIEKKMKLSCPNLLAMAGPTIGAKLILMAGSLKKLAMLPASTIQLLGAEKALFRHLKTGARCPKHGIISQHQFISSRRKQLQGKASRLLSEKITIAARVDYFKGEFCADRLLKEIEERINANG